MSSDGRRGTVRARAERLPAVGRLEGYYKYLQMMSLSVALLALWEVLVPALGVQPVILPTPSVALDALFAEFDYFAYHSWVTLYTIVIGFAVAAAVGLVLAVGIFYVDVLRRTVYPLITIVYVVPKISFAPIFLIWFGSGLTNKVALAALMAFFPMVINTYQGLREIDQEILDIGYSLEATEWFVFWRVRMPNALPFVMAGLKVGLALSVIGVIVAEFISSAEGIGHVIIETSTYARTPATFAAIFVISAISLALYAIPSYVEHRILAWYRGESG